MIQLVQRHAVTGIVYTGAVICASDHYGIIALASEDFPETYDSISDFSELFGVKLLSVKHISG